MSCPARKFIFAAGALGALALPAIASSQSAATVTAIPGPAVGDPAPDFTLAGATRYGVLKTPVRLSDLRGRTVVLAFFSRARTRG
jgi:peroxiredoxin Q/BCP